MCIGCLARQAIRPMQPCAARAWFGGMLGREGRSAPVRFTGPCAARKETMAGLPGSVRCAWSGGAGEAASLLPRHVRAHLTCRHFGLAAAGPSGGVRPPLRYRLFELGPTTPYSRSPACADVFRRKWLRFSENLREIWVRCTAPYRWRKAVGCSHAPDGAAADAKGACIMRMCYTYIGRSIHAGQGEFDGRSGCVARRP